MATTGTAPLRGDLVGGLTAAVVTIPASMGYGILALSPLGEAYVGYGAQAGLWSAIVVPLVAILLRAEGTLMYAPRGLVSFLIGSVMVHTLVGGHLVAPNAVGETLGLVFFVIFLAGACQALMGALRLGGLIRYVPFPVMAGFQNAAAVLIFLSQLPTLAGVAVAPHRLLEHLGAVRPLTVAVGLATALVTWYGARLTTRLPPPITGLIAGTAAYYALAGAGLGAGLGPTIGPLPSVVPTVYLADFARVPARLADWGDLAVLLGAALSIAMVASLDALLCAKTIEAVSGERPQGNQELLRVGAGNAVGAAAGALAAGINLAASFAAFRSGARTSRCGLVSALVVLSAVVALGPVLAYLPRVVIAGLLLVIAVQLFDRWSIQVVRAMLSGRLVHWKRMTGDLLVVVVVAVVAVAVNLVAAVGLGVAVAVVSFLTRMSHSVIRREYRGDAVHSRRTRDPAAMATLTARGGRILVLELEGPLFFGTAEALARHVSALEDDVHCVILDVKRVNEIDSTGARIVRQIHAELTGRGRHLQLSQVPTAGQLGSAFHDLGVIAAVGPARIFRDTDRALEWAEDQVLATEEQTAPEPEGELPLERMHVCDGLGSDACAALGALIERRLYGQGDVVMQEGDKSRELYMIARGTASVTVRLHGQERDNRLATFSAGTVFGEMALLDDAPRSATVRADNELVCLVLTHEAFEQLTRERTDVAIRLLTNLAREIAARLRRANRAISQLEG